MAKIIPLGGISYLDLPPDRILENNKGCLESVVIMGIDKDGAFYSASSIANGGEVLWLIELLKQELMNSADFEPS